MGPASLLRSARRGTHLSICNVAASQYAWEVPDAPGKPCHSLLPIEGSLLKSSTIVPPPQQRIVVADEVLVGYGYPRVASGFSNGGKPSGWPRPLRPSAALLQSPGIRSSSQEDSSSAAGSPASGASERQASTLAGLRDDDGGAEEQQAAGKSPSDRHSWIPTALAGTLIGTAAGGVLAGDAVMMQIVGDLLCSTTESAQSLFSGLGDILISTCGPAWSATSSSLGAVWDFYKESLVTHPHATPMVLTGMTYLAADVIAQRYEGNSLLEFKAERIARSTLTGLLILGPLAHGYYTTQDEIILRIWPDLPLHSYILKMAIDNTLYCFTYNLVYYLSLGTMKGNPVSATLEDFRGAWWRLQKAGWKFWPYVGLITHTVIPTEHKVLFVDAAEIGWVTYLSLSANSMRAQNHERLHEIMAGNNEPQEQAAKEAATPTMDATAAAASVDGHQQEAQPQHHEMRQDDVVAAGEEAVPSAGTPLRAEALENEESSGGAAAAGSPSIGTPEAAASIAEEVDVDEEQHEETKQQRTPADCWVPLPTDSFPRDHLLLANDVERAIAERLSNIETLDIESVEAFAERLSGSEQQQQLPPLPVDSSPMFITAAAAEAAPVAVDSTSAVAADVSESASLAGPTGSSTSSTSDLTETLVEEWSPEEVSVSVVQPLDLDELVQEEIVAMVHDVAQSMDEEDMNEEIGLIEVDEAEAGRQRALPEVFDFPSDAVVLDSAATLEAEEKRKKKVISDASEAA